MLSASQASVSKERVEFHFEDYRLKFGKSLEREGWEVLYVGQPFQNVFNLIPTDPDRPRYEIKAWCRRRPVEFTWDIPDKAVPAMQKLGLKLME